MSQTNLKGRLPGLDLIRFFAASSVLIYHYVSSYPPAGTTSPLVDSLTHATRYGYLGVELFFMISGFVILWSVQGRSPGQFAISRFSRLYPTFWVAMLLAAGAMVVVPEILPGLQTHEISLRQLAANATMVPGMLGTARIDEIYWTLEMELRFYFLVFLLLVFRQERHLERWVMLWLTVCTLGAFVTLPRAINFLSLNPYGPFFIVGCIVYLGYSRGWQAPRLAALLTSAVLCVMASLEVRGEFITPDALSGIVIPIAVIAIAGLLIAVVRWPTLVPNTGLIYRLGALTYPLYLTHAAIGRMMIESFAPRFGAGWAIIGTTIAALIIAWLLTVLVDEPVRKPVNRLCQRCLDGLWLAFRKLRSATAP